jgi:hypothetical protein
VFYKFCQEVGVKYAKENIQLLDLWIREGRALHWWLPYDGIVFLSQRHTTLNVDLDGRLHSDNGQSCGYSDGWGIWSWHGVNVPQSIIEHPETITVKHIQSETNAEVRRVMMERYGFARYIIDSGSKKIAEDEVGELYQEQYNATVADPAAVGIDDPLMMVKVTNSTPESDGSVKSYFLRVDPRCRPLLADQQFGEPQKLTPLNAVASTFGMTGKEYLDNLVAQT